MGAHMAFGCDHGLPLPGGCGGERGWPDQGYRVRGSDGVVARGAEVHLILRRLLCAAGLPHGAHLIRQHSKHILRQASSCLFHEVSR